jgi:hypothetical protein
MEWKIADAERDFREVVDKALHEERQTIQGDQGVVVLISQEELERIEGRGDTFGDQILRLPKVEEADFSRDEAFQQDPEPKVDSTPRNPLIEYLKNGPGFEDVDISRDKSPARYIKW